MMKTGTVKNQASCLYFHFRDRKGSNMQCKDCIWYRPMELTGPVSEYCKGIKDTEKEHPCKAADTAKKKARTE
jgi:hypothetical protein